ncbi:MAG: right-handed parallel beta-helix repeat-containing protein, partial [Synergistaceae bacterium]|nr:right-handed parallel beta-helix repeat-containing protein [Synergistaceae bacterium]
MNDKLLHLYGGFNGTETNLSNRSSDIGTTLDAQKNNDRVLEIKTNSTIDSFTITGGNTSNSGGGIYISNSSPIITNCTITGNNTTNGYGGGIYINSGSPTITNCTITGNNATGDVGGNGGGIYISNSGTPTITNCTITGNNATNTNNGYGGGIYIAG